MRLVLTVFIIELRKEACFTDVREGREVERVDIMKRRERGKVTRKGGRG